MYFNPGQEEGVGQLPPAAATAMAAEPEAEVAINLRVILFSGTRPRFIVKSQSAVLDSII